MTVPSSPGFIIHATGSRGNMPDLGKKAYRLKCRFQVPAGSGRAYLERAKYAAAEQFVADMAKRGYEHIGESHRLPVAERGWRMKFKGAHIEVMTSLPKPKRLPSAREMQAAVMQGARFLADDRPTTMTVPHFTQCEYHDYELSTIFLRDTILFEVPDLHEEKRPS